MALISDDGPNSARRRKAREAFPSSNAERMQTPVLMDTCDLHALSVCPPADTLAHCSAVMRLGHMRVGQKGIQQLLVRQGSPTPGQRCVGGKMRLSPPSGRANNPASSKTEDSIHVPLAALALKGGITEQLSQQILRSLAKAPVHVTLSESRGLY